MPTEHELRKLLEKHASGTSSPEENRLLELWFKRIGNEQTDELSDADRLRMLTVFKQNPRFGKRKAKVISLWPAWKKLAVAASIIGVAFFSGLWITGKLNKTAVQIAYITVQTGKGEVKKIVLPDGSMVWLNARTHLSYTADFKQHRFLRLNGEALFIATHDQTHPFIVQTWDGIETTDLGTQFNIHSYTKSTETAISVLSGRVSVGKIRQPVQGILLKNDAISFNRATMSFVKTQEDATTTASWRTGEWQLKGKGLNALALLLENQYGINLQHTNRALDELDLNANFNKKQTPEEIISTFCLLANCKYRWKNATGVELY